MTGKEARYATIMSENQLQFGFPYSAPNQSRLTHVILQIEKGQFICGISSCSVHIKFDEKSPVRFDANGPSDHSSTVLFLKPAPMIINALRNATATHFKPLLIRKVIR